MKRKSTAEKTGRINVTDPALRATLVEITQMDRTATSITQAIRNSANHYSGYVRIRTAPIDYTGASIDLLRDYAVYGYDFTVRAAALAEIEQRHMTDSPSWKTIVKYRKQAERILLTQGEVELVASGYSQADKTKIIKLGAKLLIEAEAQS